MSYRRRTEHHAMELFFVNAVDEFGNTTIVLGALRADWLVVGSFSLPAGPNIPFLEAPYAPPSDTGVPQWW